jgi:hypothetical protein
MESESGILFAVLVIAKVAVLVALPMVLTNLAWAGMKPLIPTDFFQVPIVYTFARVVGLSLGFALIYTQKGGAYYDLHTIFLPESPWNTTIGVFLTERVNPFNFGPGEIYARLGYSGNDALLSVAMTVMALLLAVALVSCLRIWRGKEAWSAVIVVIGTALWLTYMTIYTLSLIFWLMFVLNYWAFLLLAIIVQYYHRRTNGEH